MAGVVRKSLKEAIKDLNNSVLVFIEKNQNHPQVASAGIDIDAVLRLISFDCALEVGTRSHVRGSNLKLLSVKYPVLPS